MPDAARWLALREEERLAPVASAARIVSINEGDGTKVRWLARDTAEIECKPSNAMDKSKSKPGCVDGIPSKRKSASSHSDGEGMPMLALAGKAGGGSEATTACTCERT